MRLPPAPHLFPCAEESDEDEEDEENSEESLEDESEEEEEDVSEAPAAPPTQPPYSLIPPPPVWAQHDQGLSKGAGRGVDQGGGGTRRSELTRTALRRVLIDCAQTGS